MALRTGAPVHPGLDAALGPLAHPDHDMTRVQLRLRHHVQKRNVPALRRALDETEPTVLLSSLVLPYTIAAYELLDLPVELAVARETARQRFDRALLAAWAGAADADVWETLHLAESLRDITLPEDWVAFVAARSPNPLLHAKARTLDAFLRRDWTALATVAENALETFPTHHRFRWFAGLAQHELGNPTAAKPHLEIYVRHAHDELDHPVAQSLLHL